MYFFDKKTEYLIWKMQEGQARGVGTVRFLVMDEVCRVEIAVTGCGKVQGTYPVYLLSGHMQSLLGEIALNKGKGSLSVKCKAGALGHQAFPYTQVTGIHIDLKTEGCLEQKWLPVQGEMIEKRSNVREEETQQPDTILQEEKNNTELKRTEEDAVSVGKSEEVQLKKEVNIIDNKEEQLQKEENFVKSKEEQSIKKRDEKTGVKIVKPPKKEEFQMYTSKWQQLCAIYPVVHPFGDGRAYLSIEPRDFVVLQERFQPMVQNSFLLHGFYHYRHLLLGRQKQGNNTQYYLGVPGVFYEKEKAAALFYGFESFEGAVTPVPEGSFGYYMKRVQL